MKNQRTRSKIRPWTVILVVSALAAFSTACWDIVSSNVLFQGNPPIVGGTCTWCQENSFDTFVPGFYCKKVAQSVDHFDRICYKGTTVWDGSQYQCDYDVYDFVPIEYHPMYCTQLCTLPYPF